MPRLCVRNCCQHQRHSDNYRHAISKAKANANAKRKRKRKRKSKRKSANSHTHLQESGSAQGLQPRLQPRLRLQPRPPLRLVRAHLLLAQLPRGHAASRAAGLTVRPAPPHRPTTAAAATAASVAPSVIVCVDLWGAGVKACVRAGVRAIGRTEGWTVARGA